MARLLAWTWVLATVVTARAAEDVAPNHLAEIRERLGDSAFHLRNGGADDSDGGAGDGAVRLERIHTLVETHGGFVTDMIATYRPNLMGRWLRRATMIRRLTTANGGEEALGIAAGGRRLATGACYESHKSGQ